MWTRFLSIPILGILALLSWGCSADPLGPQSTAEPPEPLSLLPSESDDAESRNRQFIELLRNGSFIAFSSSTGEGPEEYLRRIERYQQLNARGGRRLEPQCQAYIGSALSAIMSGPGGPPPNARTMWYQSGTSKYGTAQINHLPVVTYRTYPAGQFISTTTYPWRWSPDEYQYYWSSTESAVISGSSRIVVLDTLHSLTHNLEVLDQRPSSDIMQPA